MLAWIGLLTNSTKVSPAQEFGVTLARHGRPWLKDFIKIRPVLDWSFFTPIFGGRKDSNLSTNTLTMIVAVNFSAKVSGGWKTFGMIHNKIFLLENKFKENFTPLVWKKRSGWRSLIRSPVNDDNFLKRKKIPFTRAYGWASTRMKNGIRHSSFVVLQVTPWCYSKCIIFTIHSRFKVSRLANILDVLECGRILMEE